MQRYRRIAWLVAIFVCAGASKPSAPAASLLSTVYRTDRRLEGLRDINDPTNIVAALPETRYEIVNHDAGAKTYIVRVTHVPPSKEPQRNVARGHDYIVSCAEVDEKPLARMFARGFDTGLLVAPAKYRFRNRGAPGQFVGNSTLGAAIGFRAAADVIGTTLEPIGYVGYSRISLDGASSSTATQENAITYAAGIQLVTANKFRTGVLVGWDIADNTAAHPWPYNGHLWLSLGVNFILTSAPGAK